MSANSLHLVHRRTLVEGRAQCQYRIETPPTYMARQARLHPGSHSPERRYRRFSIRYPVTVKVGLGKTASEFRAVSNNISMSGILLESDASIPPHCDVRFVVQIEGHHIIGPTQIVGEGEVVRIEPHSSGAGFAIAVKCKNPIAELRSYLPGSLT